jgi:hypothetical protein
MPHHIAFYGNLLAGKEKEPLVERLLTERREMDHSM